MSKQLRAMTKLKLQLRQVISPVAGSRYDDSRR
jgi:hypothetical protein